MTAPRMPAPAAALALALFLGGCAAAPRWTAPLPPLRAIDASAVASDVAWLADDAREGRAVGTAGLEASARWIAERFREIGLEPGAPDGSYLQRFEMPVAIHVGSAQLEVAGRALRRGEDYDALLSSASGEARGGLVFAGFGVSAPELGWDDWAGVDARGRIALVLEDRPAGDGHPLAGSKATAHLSRAAKLLAARRHGAVAVLLLPSAAEPADVLAGGAGATGGNPTLQASQSIALGLSRRAAEELVARAAGGASLAAWQREIEALGRPASRPLAGGEARVAVRIEREIATVANVVAVRRGADPELAREAVLAGAHYDHLGHGAFGSLAPDRRGEVHNGADDNASGVAGLLALARVFAAEPGRRTLVLVAFTGEEAGLVGSAEYVRSPAWPLADTVAMLNLDMIGRLREDAVTIFGVATSPSFRSLVQQASDGSGLAPAFEDDGFGPSDQTSFYARNVPVLLFFTGVHPEYHTPDDDAPLVDAAGAARVLGLVERTARALADAPRRPSVVLAAAPPGTGAGRGYGPYLGTVPEFGGLPVRGVRLAAVRAGSPAETAGLRAGDVIVELDGVAVANLEELSAVLFAARPGQRVEVAVVRDGARLRLPATLGQRR